jgi:hypothetical protein
VAVIVAHGGRAQEPRAGGADALGALRAFRRDVYGCLRRRADALFELGDALLCARPVSSLPYLSLEPAFRRSWGMVYQGLAAGRVDPDALRDVLVTHRPPGWPVVFGVDASTVPRPWAPTSPDRQFQHAAKAGRVGADPVVAGWAWQWLSQLSFDADSWTAPQDVIRVGPGDDPRRQAVEQIIGHADRLAAAGETRPPLYVHDAGYDEAALTYDLGRRGYLHRLGVLVRIRDDRVCYRDPPPRLPGPGRPRRHAKDRFACKDPATWGPPDDELQVHDDRYGHVTVHAWGGLHPKLACRGRFDGFPEPPVIKATIIRVQVEHLPGKRRRLSGPLWLWYAGPGRPDLDLCFRAYLHRFDLEHTYRFAKTALGWDDPALRHPAQFDRWTWLVITAINQLRLARTIAEDQPRPWERRRRPGRATPGRVRRDFPRLLPQLGTPASPPKPSKAGPGRPKGHRSHPAPRYDVIKKAA